EARAMSVAGAASSLTGLGMSLLIVLGVLGALGALAIGGMSGSYGLPQISLPLFWILYAIVYLAIGYGIVRLVGWAVPRFAITGWLAVLIGLLMVFSYPVLMFGGCLATYGIVQQVTR
ncbi:MAG TPA: hypothetical protein VFX74_08255, partial [Candidatus Limnocylindria bacterium]|nr:hypothetical protein [Candidatus Limnocylindria bacterium]